MKKILFVLLLMYIFHPIFGQTKGLEIKAANKNNKILLTDIIGDWYMIDSSASKIIFRNINNSLVDIIGIHHGVGNYFFIIDGDSISVNGMAANWPPYDCTVRLLNKNNIEIEFYQFNSIETTKVLYRRFLNH